MKRFVRNIILIFIPAVLLLAWYVIDDPFMMYWNYDNLYEYGQRKQCINDAYRGIRWMDLYEDSMHYNSFIIGSSRSYFYYVDDWKNYLPEKASCFHFGQSSDNLYGTMQRVRYLYNRFEHIDNLLLVIDADYLADLKPKTGLLFRQPWQVTPEKDYLRFNRECLLAFYSVEYQKRILGLDGGNRSAHFYYIPIYNELHQDEFESLLDSCPELYYASLSQENQLYSRSGKESIHEKVILEQQQQLLLELADLLESNHTDYRIVVSPLYNQIMINPEDLHFLKQTFGNDKVFDFSGINNFTENRNNYYENSHYRPKLCRELLEIIYKNETINYCTDL